MANIVKHRFASAKSDGADATQVQPSHWNDGHAFSGGNAGDVLIRDPTDATFGAAWTRGQFVTTSSTGSSVALDPTALTHVVQLTGLTRDFYGVTPSSGTFRVGTILKLCVLDVGDITLYHLSSALATGRLVNRIAAPRATVLRGLAGGGLAIGGTADYFWDGGNWLMLAHEMGGELNLTMTNANFTGFTCASPFTRFYLHGSDVTLRFYFPPCTVPSSVAKLTITGWLWTFVGTGAGPGPFAARYTPVAAINWIPCIVTLGTGGTSLDLIRPDYSNFAAGDYYLTFDVTLPIR